MSKMAELAAEIENLYLVDGLSKREISDLLNVDIDLVRDFTRRVDQELLAHIPPQEMPTAEELEHMAEYYGA